jgi:hypothetical protein
MMVGRSDFGVGRGVFASYLVGRGVTGSKGSESAESKDGASCCSSCICNMLDIV